MLRLAAVVAGAALVSGCFQEEEAPRHEAPSLASMQTARRASIGETGSVANEDPEPAVAELAETIRHAEDPEARREAVYAAADTGRDDAAAIVGEALTDPEVEVRMAAVESLTGFEETGSADWLSIGLGDPDPRVRRAAVEALGEIDGDSARLLLRQALGDVDAGVREAARQMLAEPPSKRSGLR